MSACPRRFRVPFLVTLGLAVLPGCFGVSGNPSYVPHLFPKGDIIRTHAKPPGKAYFSNFDPHAVRLEVRPLESTNPVRMQYVLLATVYDEDGKPRRDRRVEWMLEGVGNIVEVDESGVFPGRGYKVDNRYAVSYTDYHEHRITRGTDNPNDDFVVRPGQSWCVITSAVEGDTYVTVYAPEIHNWERHKVVVTNHWVDAEWQLPPAAANRAGVQHVLTTRVFRHTDHQPLANYRVRYRLLDGPPAMFLPGRGQEEVAVTDLSGNAHVAVAQIAPAFGVNRVGIEIIRAPDPTTPSGTGIVVGRGEVSLEWLAPSVSLAPTAPATVAVGQDIPYTITLSNRGKVETRALTVRSIIPDGLQYVRSEPPAIVEGNQLIWTLGELPAGQERVLQAVFRAVGIGTFTHRASVVTEEGLRDEKTATTQVTAPQLKVSVTGPATGTVGFPLTYQVTVSNPGTGPAANAVLSADFDAGLEHESRANPVEVSLGAVAAGATQEVPLTLTPRQSGNLVTRVTARADGNLSDRAQHSVTVQTARLGLNVTGPQTRYVDRPAVWDLRVSNPNAQPLASVALKYSLPPELTFQSATNGGQMAAGNVVWDLGTLQPGEEKRVQVTAAGARLARQALATAEATAAPDLRVQAQSAIDILGLPALRMDLQDVKDPIEVGERTSYRILVQNQGSLPASGVEIIARLPPEMRLVDAKGPTRHELNGQEIRFPPGDAIPPKQTAEYVVEVEALKPGDLRFRAELRSTALTEPVVEEESTNVLASRLAPVAPSEGQRP